jgi:nucleoid DNA-binding protein
MVMINKKDIAKKIIETNLLTAKEGSKIVEEIFDYIQEALLNGEEISIVGFGKFFLYEHNPRPVRNPKTLEPMTLVPYKSVKFKLSDKLKRKFKR